MKLIQKALLIGLGMAAVSSSAMAAFTFTNGDLILGFQATGGTGSDKNVYFDLGSGVSFRNNGNVGLIGNISTVLSSTYGANWYSRTDLYFGVIGNLNDNPTTGIGAQGAVAGDPSRTHYISAPTAAPQGGVLRSAGSFSSSALGTAGGLVSSMEGTFAGLTQTANNTVTVDQQDSPAAWSNGWSARNPVPGGAFNTFTGGIQQNFGKATDATYVDVQRILATNTNANPTGVVGGGTYETSFAIGMDGSVTALSQISAVPETSSSLLVAAIGVSVAFKRRRRQLA